MKEKNTEELKPEEVISLVKDRYLSLKYREVRFLIIIKVNVAVMGASGYTGSEVLRILLKHPLVKIKALIGKSTSWQKCF